MEPPVLTDKNQFPTDEVIYSHIGKSKKLWDPVFEYIYSVHPELNSEWKYYNDGKSWLMKMTRKSKTVFWLSVLNNTFRITFYFPERTVETICSSASPELKKRINESKTFGKTLGITTVFKNTKDIKLFKELIEIKLKIK